MQKKKQIPYGITKPLLEYNEQLKQPPSLTETELIQQGNTEQADQQKIALLEEQDAQEESDDEADEIEDMKIKQALLQQNLQKRANEKMVVGTGFSMDVTQFFQFEKKKELASGAQANIFEEISGSRLAWIILLYSVTSGAMIPGWIMNIKANKILRISWRFFMQAFMVIPFVLYEYRSGGEEVKKKYEWKYIFNPQNLIKPLVSSFAVSMWFTMILFGFEWTSVSHSIVMGSMSNFFLSIGRSRRKASHDLQSGGQLLVIAGITLMLIDSYKFNSSSFSSHDYSVVNTFYFNRQWFQRMTFDLSSFTMSYFMSQFSKYTSDLKNYYPPFLSMFIVNICNFVLMAFSCFFFHGCSFDFNSYWGIWSLFSNLHFAGFMYMAIILSLGQIVSLVLITRMFPDPIIPALAMTLQPFIATFILDLTDVQRMPGQFSIIGYVFMVPGLSLILVGQCLFQRITTKKQTQDKRALQLMRELKQIDMKVADRKERAKSRSNRARLQISNKQEGTPAK